MYSNGIGVSWGPLKRNLVVELMTAYTPSSAGQDLGVFIIPQDPNDGISNVNYTLKRVNVRAETATGVSTLQITKYSGTGTFTGNNVLSGNIIINNTNEYNTTSFTGYGATAVTNDKYAVNFISTSANVSNYTVQLIFRET